MSSSGSNDDLFVQVPPPEHNPEPTARGHTVADELIRYGDRILEWKYFTNWWFLQKMRYFYIDKNIYQPGTETYLRGTISKVQKQIKNKENLCTCRPLDSRNRCAGINCERRKLHILCPESCGCKNRGIIHKHFDCLSFRSDGTCRIVLYTDEFIVSNSVIMEYVGEVTFTRPYKNQFYVIQLKYFNKGRLVFIDARRMGNESRMMAHSANPNCVISEWACDGHVRALVVARRDIQAGETLTLKFPARDPELFENIRAVEYNPAKHPDFGYSSPPKGSKPGETEEERQEREERAAAEMVRRRTEDLWGVKAKHVSKGYPKVQTGPNLQYPNNPHEHVDGWRRAFVEGDETARAAATADYIDENKRAGYVGIPYDGDVRGPDRVNIDRYHEPPAYPLPDVYSDSSMGPDAVVKYKMDGEGKFICHTTGCYFRSNTEDEMLEHIIEAHSAKEPIRTERPSQVGEDKIRSPDPDVSPPESPGSEDASLPGATKSDESEKDDKES